MSEHPLIEFGRSLPGVVVDTVGEGSGAPEVAWGDSFFYYDPGDDPGDRRHPFATIVTKDYTGFDEVSDLDRDGVFRLNVAVGRAAFTELLGYAPAEQPEHADEFDYTQPDVVLPHPIYAAQGWVSIVTPGEQTLETALRLLAAARDLAEQRHHRRAQR